MKKANDFWWIKSMVLSTLKMALPDRIDNIGFVISATNSNVPLEPLL